MGESTRSLLAHLLGLPHGMASHDTFTRVFALLSPAVLQEVLVPWLLARRGVPGECVHLDGKTLRGTWCQRRKLKALHVVSAWAGQSGITLGQVAVADKSNEITAMPELLHLLDLHEKIVTIDAMGCQKAIAETIVAGGGDYILAVKDNQPTLHAEMQAAFAQAPPPTAIPPGRNHLGSGARPRGTAHGPGVARAGVSVRAQDALWLGVLSVVMVTREVWCQATGAQSTEVSYFLSSLPPNARRIGRRFEGTGALRTDCTGCWMWYFAKTPGGSMIARRRRTWRC